MAYSGRAGYSERAAPQEFEFVMQEDALLRWREHNRRWVLHSGSRRAMIHRVADCERRDQGTRGTASAFEGRSLGLILMGLRGDGTIKTPSEGGVGGSSWAEV